MTLLATIIVDPLHRRGDDQRLVSALANLGLQPWLDGTKGRVHLPPGTFAALFPGTGRRATEQLQQRLTNDVDLALTAGGIKANVFVTIAATWSWHYRPVPRKHHDLAYEREHAITSDCDLIDDHHVA